MHPLARPRVAQAFKPSGSQRDFQLCGIAVSQGLIVRFGTAMCMRPCREGSPPTTRDRHLLHYLLGRLNGRCRSMYITLVVGHSALRSVTLSRESLRKRGRSPGNQSRCKSGGLEIFPIKNLGMAYNDTFKSRCAFEAESWVRSRHMH